MSIGQKRRVLEWSLRPALIAGRDARTRRRPQSVQLSRRWFDEASLRLEVGQQVVSHSKPLIGIRHSRKSPLDGLCKMARQDVNFIGGAYPVDLRLNVGARGELRVYHRGD